MEARIAGVPAEIRADELQNTSLWSSHRTTYDILTLQYLRFLEVPNILNRWCLYMLRLDISRVVLKQRMRQSINQQQLCSFNHHQWHLYRLS